MLQKINTLVVGGGNLASGKITEGNNMQQDAVGDMYRKVSGSFSSSEGSDYFKDKVSGK
jgi:hypothetical protein